MTDIAGSSEPNRQEAKEKEQTPLVFTVDNIDANLAGENSQRTRFLLYRSLLRASEVDYVTLSTFHKELHAISNNPNLTQLSDIKTRVEFLIGSLAGVEDSAKQMMKDLIQNNQAIIDNMNLLSEADEKVAKRATKKQSFN